MKAKASTLKEAIESTQVSRDVEAEMDRLAPVFSAGILFNQAVEELPVEQKVVAYELLDSFMAMFKERKEQFRDGLFRDADRLGVPNENGTMIMDVDGSRVMKVRSAKETINSDKLKEVLKEANIKIEDVFKTKIETHTTTSVVVDESMLAALVETGKISKEKFQSTKVLEEKFTIRVEPSEEIDTLLESARGKMAALPPKKSKKK